MIADFRKKQKSSSSGRHLLKLAIGIVLVLSVFLVITDINMYHKRQQLNSQIENLKNKIEDTKNKNSNLKENIAKENDDAHIEKVAREELDLQKPGEKVFSFVSVPGQQENSKVQQNSWQGWLGNIWNWVTGF